MYVCVFGIFVCILPVRCRFHHLPLSLFISWRYFFSSSFLPLIFTKIISNRLGFISLDEFAEACDLLQKHLPEHDSKEELLEMCKLMDINKDSLVDLNEFLETFRLCEQERGNSYKSEVLAVHFDLPNDSTTAPETATASTNDVNNDNGNDNDNNIDSKNIIINRNATATSTAATNA